MRFRLAVVGSLGLLAAVLVAVAVAATTAASNRRAARRDTRQLLTTFIAPPGATRSATDPSAHHLLRSAVFEPATIALVDRHQFWRVAEPPSAAYGWIKSHVPSGSKLIMTGSSSGPGYYVDSLGFGFPATANVLTSRVLAVSVTAARGGGAAIRVDAEDIWLVPRSPAERVPAGVHLVTYTVTRLDVHTGKTTTSAPADVTSQSDVSQIVSLVNGLQRAQPGVVPCPADFGPFVDLKFYGQRGGPLLAEANGDGSGCDIVSFTLRGKHEPSLAGGDLVQQLEKLLGFKG
jgi:hypothetical protein